MESPSYMTPLSQCWKLDCPPPNEPKGKMRVDMLKTQLQKFDHITKQYKVSTTSTTAFVCAVILRCDHTRKHSLAPCRQRRSQSHLVERQ